MNRYTSHRATSDDINPILDLFEKTIRNSADSYYSKHQINAWVSSIENKERWLKKIVNQYFIIAKCNSEWVGFGSLDKDYIDMLFVDFKWQRKGVANFIFDELLRQAKQSKIVQLTTYASKMAVPLFKAKGFEIVKENKIIRNGVELTNFEMLREL